MPATRSGTATLRISASWAHRSKLMSPSELACSLLPLPGLGCATWSWRTGSWILRKSILAGLCEDPCLALRDQRSTDFHVAETESWRRNPQFASMMSQRGLTAATKLEDWVDYAIRSDCALYSLAQFDNLAQKTRLSRLVVQRKAWSSIDPGQWSSFPAWKFLE